MSPTDDEAIEPEEPGESKPSAGSRSPATADRWARAKTMGRWLLFVFGVGAVVYLVMDAGPSAVLAILVAAGVFLPFVMLAEVGFATMDAVALRVMYGERGKDIPLRVWVRSAMMAYGVMIVLPAGRAGGEVIRAASFAPYIGSGRAAAGGTYLQGATLWGNTLVSIPCYVALAIASGPFSGLSLLVLGNAIATAVLGSLVLFGARFSKIGGWLGKKIKALSSQGSAFDSSLREMPSPAVPVAAALVGRLFQSVQYGVILLAVGSSVTLGSAFVAQAIHLVGAGFGDLVPNQAGITEGAYRVFASHLGLEAAAAQAIAIPLIHRICQLFLAATSLAVGTLWKPSRVDAGPAIS